jgi:hypothetical protein
MNEKKFLIATLMVLVACNGVQAGNGVVDELGHLAEVQGPGENLSLTERVQLFASQTRTRVRTFFKTASPVQRVAAGAAVVAAVLGIDLAQGAVKSSDFVLDQAFKAALAKIDGIYLAKKEITDKGLDGAKHVIEEAKTKKKTYFERETEELKTAKRRLAKKPHGVSIKVAEEGVTVAEAKLERAKIKKAVLAGLRVPKSKEDLTAIERELDKLFSPAKAAFEKAKAAKENAGKKGRVRAAVDASLTGRVVTVVGKLFERPATKPATGVDPVGTHASADATTG